MTSLLPNANDPNRSPCIPQFFFFDTDTSCQQEFLREVDGAANLAACRLAETSMAGEVRWRMALKDVG